MAPQPTVGLVGSRKIDEGLQSAAKKTVTEYAFPKDSRTPMGMKNKDGVACGIPKEGSVGNTLPKGGDCMLESCESTHMLSMFVLLLVSMFGTYQIGMMQQ